MQSAAVVPDQHIAFLPLMAIDIADGGRSSRARTRHDFPPHLCHRYRRRGRPDKHRFIAVMSADDFDGYRSWRVPRAHFLQLTRTADRPRYRNERPLAGAGGPVPRPAGYQKRRSYWRIRYRPLPAGLSPHRGSSPDRGFAKLLSVCQREVPRKIPPVTVWVIAVWSNVGKIEDFRIF